MTGNEIKAQSVQQALVVEGLHAYYGNSHVLQGVTLSVQPGEVVALLGRNGAGKTTTFRSVIGLMNRTRGQMRLGDVSLSGKKPYQVSRLGIAYVPSGRRSFAAMTVRENLQITVDGRPAGTRTAGVIDNVLQLFPPLAKRLSQPAGVLSGGENQMLKMACAFLMQPKILLLDEPTEGLAPLVVSDLLEQVRDVAATGVGILLAEQNARFALHLSERAYVLDKGIVKMHGQVNEVAENEELLTYLGI